MAASNLSGDIKSRRLLQLTSGGIKRAKGAAGRGRCENLALVFLGENLDGGSDSGEEEEEGVDAEGPEMVVVAWVGRGGRNVSGQDDGSYVRERERTLTNDGYRYP